MKTVVETTFFCFFCFYLQLPRRSLFYLRGGTLQNYRRVTRKYYSTSTKAIALQTSVTFSIFFLIGGLETDCLGRHNVEVTGKTTHKVR